MKYTDLPFRVQIVGTQDNVPNWVLNPGTEQYITVHDTGNPDFQADAQMHADFVANGGGTDNVSFHFTVDDKEAIQILECWRVGFHAGDNCDNRATDFGCFQSLAIETCINVDGDWSKTKHNLSKLIAMIVQGDERIISLKKDSYSLSRTVMHQRWSGKYCARRILDEGSFPIIIAEAAELMTTEKVYAPARPDLQTKLGDLNHISINGARVYRFRDWVVYENAITPRQYSSLTAPAIAKDVPAGTPIQMVAYIAQASGFKWFLGKDNGRYLMTDQPLTVT